MSLAYTAPTWTNGSGTGISASQLQALSDCMEGLVQGSDKAITDISIRGSLIDLTFADGSTEIKSASGLKGISSIAKTGTVGNVDTYTILYTNGTSTTFTVTNGVDGVDGVSPEITITSITGGHRVEITDADHPTGQTFDVMDGANTVIPNPQGTSVGDLTSIGINGEKYDIQGIDENAYHIGDTAETALADGDYFPFYDTSASAKRKTLWSNIKSVLSNLFAKKTDIAPVENDTTASRAYAIGQQFYLNGSLYRVTQAIASGGDIIIDTNAELAPSVAEQLYNKRADELLYVADVVSSTYDSSLLLSDLKKYDLIVVKVGISSTANSSYQMGSYILSKNDIDDLSAGTYYNAVNVVWANSQLYNVLMTISSNNGYLRLGRSTQGYSWSHMRIRVTGIKLN